jgi:hypothetical protein
VRVAIPLCKASALFEEYKVCACAQEKNAENEKKFGVGNCTCGRIFGDARALRPQSVAATGIARAKSVRTLARERWIGSGKGNAWRAFLAL